MYKPLSNQLLTIYSFDIPHMLLSQLNNINQYFFMILISHYIPIVCKPEMN